MSSPDQNATLCWRFVLGNELAPCLQGKGNNSKAGDLTDSRDLARPARKTEVLRVRNGICFADLLFASIVAEQNA